MGSFICLKIVVVNKSKEELGLLAISRKVFDEDLRLESPGEVLQDQFPIFLPIF